MSAAGEGHGRVLGVGSRACTMRASRVSGRRSYGPGGEKSKAPGTPSRLTLAARSVYLLALVFERPTSMDWAAGHDADVQAPQSQAGEQARVPSPHEDQGRAQDAQPSETPRAGAHRDHDGEEVGASRGPRAERFPREARIRKGSEIRRLIEVGARRSTPHLDVFVGRPSGSRSRLGLIVPKHGRRVVDRNQLKRRLREIGRRRVLPALDACGKPADVLVRARGGAYRAEFETLARELAEAVEAMCSDGS